MVYGITSYTYNAGALGTDVVTTFKATDGTTPVNEIYLGHQGVLNTGFLDHFSMTIDSVAANNTNAWLADMRSSGGLGTPINIKWEDGAEFQANSAGTYSLTYKYVTSKTWVPITSA